MIRHMQQPEQERRKEDDDHYQTNEAERLTHNGEHGVIDGFRQITRCLDAVANPHPC